MNNPQQKNSSNLPLVIIGLVLVAAIGGGWWLYSRSKAQPVKTNTNSSTANKPAVDNRAALELYAKAPAGAQPANMLGSQSATVVVEEFADFQCGTCAAVHPKLKEINSIYSGRIKFIYRNFPLTQIHKNAYEAAVAVEAAGMQGKFWAMQDQLFSNQQAWSNSNDARKLFEEYAQKIGLNVPQFQSDVLGLPAKNRVNKDLERGLALGINGTPTVFINGVRIGAEQIDVNTMRQFIDAELQRANSQAQPNQLAVQTPPSNASVKQPANGSNASPAANSANKK